MRGMIVLVLVADQPYPIIQVENKVLRNPLPAFQRILCHVTECCRNLERRSASPRGGHFELIVLGASACSLDELRSTVNSYMGLYRVPFTGGIRQISGVKREFR